MLMSAAFLFSALVQFALALVVAALLGPGEFGLYALVVAGGILLQALLLDGLRLVATRLHHAQEETGLRRRLEGYYRRIGAGLVVAGAIVALLPVERAVAYALVPLVAIINGFADFRLALFRAEFDHKRFVRFMVSRNGVALVATPLAAWATGRAEAAVVAFALSALLATLVEELHLPPARAATQAPVPLGQLLGYAGPLVATNACYLGFFFLLRALVAHFGGLAASGQFSLALDFVLKLFSTAGTALDLALFPLALKAEREAGPEAAQAQAGINLERVLAVLAPMALGLALVAPGLEPLLVAPAFRGTFAAQVLCLTPGVALYALAQYGLHPFAQLRHTTPVLAAAAGLALAAGTGLALVLGKQGDLARMAGLALALAMALAVLRLGLAAGRAGRLPARFLASLAACLALLGVVVMPFAAMGFTPATLLAAIALGALAYTAGAFALDLAGLRAWLKRA